jgi:mRNA-degrading endonuclease toxin of MazEF toxin-antitoxin module
MNKGDIVLVSFPFTDLTGIKNRPALILIDSKDDVTVCFITTRLKWQTEFDISINPSEKNGLKKISLIRLNKIATVDKDLLIGRLGTLEDHYIDLLNKNLARILRLEK